MGSRHSSSERRHPRLGLRIRAPFRADRPVSGGAKGPEPAAGGAAGWWAVRASGVFGCGRPSESWRRVGGERKPGEARAAVGAKAHRGALGNPAVEAVGWGWHRFCPRSGVRRGHNLGGVGAARRQTQARAAREHRPRLRRGDRGRGTGGRPDREARCRGFRAGGARRAWPHAPSPLPRAGRRAPGPGALPNRVCAGAGLGRRANRWTALHPGTAGRDRREGYRARGGHSGCGRGDVSACGSR